MRRVGSIWPSSVCQLWQAPRVQNWTQIDADVAETCAVFDAGSQLKAGAPSGTGFIFGPVGGDDQQDAYLSARSDADIRAADVASPKW